MTPKIDIIIPVYNAKKYLAKCICSVQKQTFTDWNLILVDDGSNDGSSEVCDNFAAADGRISVIHQENCGSLWARLNGIEKSTNEFVAFVDADDLIEPNMLQKLVNTQVQYSADIVCCKFKTLSRRGWIKRKHSLNSNAVTISSAKKEAINMAASISALNLGLWGKLYRRTLFTKAWNEIKTIPSVFWGEDSMVNATVFNSADIVVSLEDALYNYRIGGFSSRCSEKTMHELSELYAWRKAFLLSKNADIYFHKTNLVQVLNAAVYYAHYSKLILRRQKICSELAVPINDIEMFYPDYKHKTAYDPNNAMTDEAFKNIYHESIMVLIKQIILRTF